MPETFPQWLWFTFFAGGSVCGWFLVTLFFIRQYSRRRMMREIEYTPEDQD